MKVFFFIILDTRFYINFHKTNGYIKDYDGSTYLKLIPSNEKGKNLIKK